MALKQRSELVKDEDYKLLNEGESNFTDLCVCCGKPVPEGTMVCFECEEKSKEDLIRESGLNRLKWTKE